jgi:hypothetical protein
LQVVHNADYWRMATQKSFLLKPGEPGSISLYKSRSRSDHARFASEICAEKLIEFIIGDRANHYLWHFTPGARNDLLDGLVGSAVAAAISGAALTGGARGKKSRRLKIRKRKI